MGACQVQRGISNVCGDLLFPGGADKDFWIFYISNLGQRLVQPSSGVITGFTFQAYGGFVKFEGQKFSNKFDSEYQVGAGGNGSFLHRGTVKLVSLSTVDDIEIQRLLQAQDAGIVYQDNNDSFFISGYGKGLAGRPGPVQSTGLQTTDDVTDTVILEGAEKSKPLRFLVTDVATTLAYLNARVI